MTEQISPAECPEKCTECKDEKLRKAILGAGQCLGVLNCAKASAASDDFSEHDQGHALDLVSELLDVHLQTIREYFIDVICGGNTCQLV